MKRQLLYCNIAALTSYVLGHQFIIIYWYYIFYTGFQHHHRQNSPSSPLLVISIICSSSSSSKYSYIQLHMVYTFLPWSKSRCYLFFSTSFCHVHYRQRQQQSGLILYWYLFLFQGYSLLSTGVSSVRSAIVGLILGKGCLAFLYW